MKIFGRRFSFIEMIGMAILAIIVVFGILFSQLPSASQTVDQDARYPDRQGMENGCEKLVKNFSRNRVLDDMLKSPSTARYHPASGGVYRLGESWGERAGELACIVEGEVDAQNSFGALIRSKYEVTFAWNGSEWKASGIREINR